MKIEVIVEKTSTGYPAYAAKHPVYTVGTTLGGIRINMLDALNLFFEGKATLVTESNIKLIPGLKSKT